MLSLHWIVSFDLSKQLERSSIYTDTFEEYNDFNRNRHEHSDYPLIYRQFNNIYSRDLHKTHSLKPSHGDVYRGPGKVQKVYTCEEYKHINVFQNTLYISKDIR